jgi:hypothetical protein
VGSHGYRPDRTGARFDQVQVRPMALQQEIQEISEKGHPARGDGFGRSNPVRRGHPHHSTVPTKTAVTVGGGG